MVPEPEQNLLAPRDRIRGGCESSSFGVGSESVGSSAGCTGSYDTST